MSPSSYLTQLFEPNDVLALVLLNKTTSQALQRIAPVVKLASASWQAWLRYMNAHRYEIYCSVNTLVPDATRRNKAHIAEIRHIYLDFDDDGHSALARLRTRTDIPQPNYILNTSPGKFQVLWRVSGFDLATAESTLHSLARDTGADIAVTDAARVLRLPGFYNHKYCPSHRVTLEVLHSSVAPASAFSIVASPPPVCTSYAPAPGAPTNGQTDHTRSGLDWRRTLSQLRQGADPALVAAQLASERSDKSNPQYYAERTVSRALAIIDRTSPRGRRPRSQTQGIV